jgi:uncharacterized protein
MPIVVNLRHLEAHNVNVEGELPVKELDLDTRDEVIQVTEPLTYDLEVQNLEDGLLVQGRLGLALDCRCVRCLKPFKYALILEEWTYHLPLEGEDRVPVVNDLVDLTPAVREDILLAFPQHPLCEPECRGLISPRKDLKSGGAQESQTSSAWAELNKLKL